MALPDVYTSADKATMDAIKAALALLKPSEKVLLDLSKYTALLSAYEADVPEVVVPDDSTPDPEPEPDELVSTWKIVLIVLASVIVLSGAGIVAYVLVKRKNKSEKTEKITEEESITQEDAVKGDDEE